MPEALLGPQQLASSDEEGRHAVAQAMQGGPGDFGPPGELGEPVAEGASGQPDVGGQPSGENSHGPRARAVGKPAGPGLCARAPQLDRLPPEGEPAGPARLGGPEHVGRDASLDREHPTVEVVEAQRHQLATPRARVRGQADEQPDLLGLVPALRILAAPAEATSASAASSRRSTSSVLRCSRVPGRVRPAHAARAG